MARRPIEVKGLDKLRRDLRRVDKEAVKEIRRTIRGAAQIVAKEAAALTPRRTGTLADSYRGTTAGTKGVVRSPVSYARAVEFGGHPRGGSTFVPGVDAIGRAIERREGEVIDALGDGVDRAARQVGWR